LGSTIRFWIKGWIETSYLQPSFHFKYFGFDWVSVLPGFGTYWLYAVLGISSVSLAIGLWSRTSAALVFVTFTYAEMIDQTLYLNHYYLVSLIALLLIFIPCGHFWSVDSYRQKSNHPSTVGAWAYWLLRFQIAAVYMSAGLAKLNPDWLMRGEPLHTWLQARADLPWVGQTLADPFTAMLMSWGGAFYDLFIVALLLWKPTRSFAYLTVIVFHCTVGLLFPIGVFPLLMIGVATIFFSPSWPRRWLGQTTVEPTPGRHLHPIGITLASFFVTAQIVMPLRHLAYPGAVNWTEEGFRFSWRVMLIEKTGSVEFRVQTDSSKRAITVFPRDELTDPQYKMMSTQPDFILQYAHHLRDQFESRGHTSVQVYADAWASLNGRPSQRLVDPTIDLAQEPWSIQPATWIVPLNNSS
jgi:hypothetical protein